MRSKLMIILALASVISFGSLAYAQDRNNRSQAAPTRPVIERRDEKRKEMQAGRRTEWREGKREGASESRSRHHKRHRHMVKKGSISSSKARRG
ncbi:MAG: hypothetical protein ABI596_12595 [Pyrinomonadaceae bacterium]